MSMMFNYLNRIKYQNKKFERKNQIYSQITLLIILLNVLGLFSLSINKHCKVASSNTSHFEAHAGLFRLSMKRNFHAHALWPFGKKAYFWISNVCFISWLYSMTIFLPHFFFEYGFEKENCNCKCAPFPK